jgi:cytoskeletal protein CcmA (bactofilin family)
MSPSLLNKMVPLGNDRVPDGARPAIDPGVSAPNHVGSAVRIEGEISGQQDLLVDGEVAGKITISGHTLTVGAKGDVKADIRAKNVVLVGNVVGNIEASGRIEVRGQCNLLGNVRSPRIMIENGAYIKGSIEVIRPESVPPTSQGDSSATPDHLPLES